MSAGTRWRRARDMWAAIDMTARTAHVASVRDVLRVAVLHDAGVDPVTPATDDATVLVHSHVSGVVADTFRAAAFLLGNPTTENVATARSLVAGLFDLADEARAAVSRPTEADPRGEP